MAGDKSNSTQCPLSRTRHCGTRCRHWDNRRARSSPQVRPPWARTPVDDLSCSSRTGRRYSTFTRIRAEVSFGADGSPSGVRRHQGHPMRRSWALQSSSPTRRGGSAYSSVDKIQLCIGAPRHSPVRDRGRAWEPLSPLPAPAAAAPGGVLDASGNLVVLVQAAGTLCVLRQDLGTWPSQWISLGSPPGAALAPLPPVAAVDAQGFVEVFTTAGGGIAWIKEMQEQPSSAAGWTGWTEWPMPLRRPGSIVLPQ